MAATQALEADDRARSETKVAAEDLIGRQVQPADLNTCWAGNSCLPCHPLRGQKSNHRVSGKNSGRFSRALWSGTEPAIRSIHVSLTDPIRAAGHDHSWLTGKGGAERDIKLVVEEPMPPAARDDGRNQDQD